MRLSRSRPDIAHAFSVGVMRRRRFAPLGQWPEVAPSRPPARWTRCFTRNGYCTVESGRIVFSAISLNYPTGSIVCRADEAFTMVKGKAFRWTDTGYDPPETILHADSLITPPSSVMALQAGYRAVLHPFINLC